MDLNPPDGEMDEAIGGIARRLYGRQPRVRKCNSQVNYCAVLEFGGALADRVIKLSHRNRWAIEVERLAYPAMRDCGLPVPEIEYTHLDDPEPSEPFLVMPKFSDSTLTRLDPADSRLGVRACRESGAFTHELHSRFYEGYQRLLQVEEARGQLEAVQQGLNRGPNLDRIRDRLPDLVGELESQIRPSTDPATRLIHGQLHTENIMVDGGGEICVVDFGETIGMGPPLQDLLMLLTSHEGWSRGAGDEARTEAILDGFGTLSDADLAALRRLELVNYAKALCDSAEIAGTAHVEELVRRIRRIQAGESLLPL